MSEVVSFSKKEWEAFLKDSEELMNRYDSLLKRVNELEESKKRLEQRLLVVQGQLRETEEMKHAAEVEKEQELMYGRENIHRLHSRVSDLLQTEIPESSASEEVEVMMETLRSTEQETPKESESVEDVLKQRRDAVRKLLDESEEI